MSLVEQLKQISLQTKSLDNVQTEEATKHSLVLPFIQALGYNVFNSQEVIPEFTADVADKKGEKVDYAIKQGDKVAMLIECKHHTTKLSKEHTAQLYRYFSVVDARFAILTNGITYQFYADLDKDNKMDDKPFFTFDITTDIKESKIHQINELEKFAKSSFDEESILDTAKSLKYANAIKKILSEELNEPSDQFIKFFASQIYEGSRITQKVIEELRIVVKETRKQFINDKIHERLESAQRLDNQDRQAEQEKQKSMDEVSENKEPTLTEEENEGFYTIKSILREVLDVSRLTIEPVSNGSVIRLDNNIQKFICRFHFNIRNKYLIIGKEKERNDIESVDDIYKCAEKIKKAASLYND